ncbi:MAG: penicillin acylase family protein [Acidimicrobiales bacterium]
MTLVLIGLGSVSAQAGVIPSATVPAGPFSGTALTGDASGGRTFSILPAGENGLVNGLQLLQFEANGSRPPHSSDQLGPYSDLLRAPSPLPDSQLSTYFNQESFGLAPGDVVRTEYPSPHRGVVIYRDGHDVPHIYGNSLAAMAYGAGYAAAEDRLFLMDVLRHYGEGDLAAFVGPSCSIEQMDHDQLLSAGYTPAQRQAQLDALPHRYGRLGTETLSMVDAYVAGINRYINKSRVNLSLLPADYLATASLPTLWQPSDVVAVISLIGLEATGGGSELKNAALLRYLQSRLGPQGARAAFASFKSQNDPAAPTTIHNQTFAYMVPGHIDPSLTAIPDHPAAPLSGGPTDTTPGCGLTVTPTPGTGLTAPTTSNSAQAFAQSLPSALSTLLRPHSAESNALLIDAAHSAGGHPVAVFGPELGYYAPQILMEEDLHAPGYAAEGAAFPGAGFVVELGRAGGFAWSATTASTDQIDVRVEKLCNPAGGVVSAHQADYVFDGRCQAMDHHHFIEAAVTKPGGTGLPALIDHSIYSTVHGIVRGWTTLAGRPVAIVAQRSTFDHEPDSLVGFLAWGQPGLTHDPASWMRGAADIAYSFNWFYVDSAHIAYYVSGRDPIRNPHVDPNLPSWGTGVAEWTGLLSNSAHPHALDPNQGYLTSWNNKPAPGFSASDDNYGWGPVQRSQLLDDQVAKLLAQGQPITRGELVSAMETAATQDLSGVAVVDQVLSEQGVQTDPRLEAMTAQLRVWAATGAHRIKGLATDTQYAHAPAIAIWDQAYPGVVRALFDPLFAPGGLTSFDGLSNGYSVLPMEFADTPNGDGSHHGDGYYAGWEGYVVKALRQMAGQRVQAPFPAAVFDRLCGGPSRCHQAITSALLDAYTQLARINGTTNVAAWTADTATATESGAANTTVTMPQFDAINYMAIGIVGQPSQEWVNRPTFQQVTQFVRPPSRN